MNSLGPAPQQRGFSLPEALIAVFLLSVSLLGLLQYYQALSTGFTRQWQFRQAWSQAQNLLEAYVVTGKNLPLSSWPSLPGWHGQIVTTQATSECIKATAQIQTPGQYRVELSRWLCKSAAD